MWKDRTSFFAKFATEKGVEPSASAAPGLRALPLQWSEQWTALMLLLCVELSSLVGLHSLGIRGESPGNPGESR